MTISENELEDLIFADLSYNDGIKLYNNGFELDVLTGYKWFRQVNIEPYGIIDILGIKRINGRLLVHILELKVVKLDSNHFDQVLRYKLGVERILQQKFSSFTIVPSLIGLEMSSGHYIHNNTTVNVATFNYDIDGIVFKSHGIKGRWIKPSEENLDINRIWQRIAR